jgi:hypothetical protein
MIHMPRRSVTRFFVPLIDVLILLFCIFLLMEFNTGTKYEQQTIDVETQSTKAQLTEEALLSRTKELQVLEERLQKLEENPLGAELLRAQEEIDRMRKELDRLKSIGLQDRAAFRVLHINGKDGTLFYYDDETSDKPITLPDAKAAKALIERHQKEAKGREVYYYFMPPRPAAGYPTAGQNRTYKQWFAKTANSLAENR